MGKNKRAKQLTKTQKNIYISILVLLLILIVTASIIIINKNKDVNQITCSATENLIPNITDENIKININTLEETESLTVKVEEKLNDYNLYYLIKNVGEQVQEIADTTNTIDENNFSLYTKYTEEILITENCTIYFVYEKDGEYSKEKYELVITNIVKALQGEEVSEEEIKKEQVDKNNKANSKSPYYIKVNYGANTVTIYGKDENGDYTVPVKAMICSCGISTPKSGVYKTSKGFQWGTLYGGVYGMYSTRIVRNILFHSVPYTAPRNDALEYWEFDKLGTKAAAGCIRLMVSDAKWIFYNCGSGTMVEFYSSAEPGPLGKPSAPKISNNELCRNWDPTDDTPGNPWYASSNDESQTGEEIITPPENFDNIITDDTIITD